MKRFIFAPRRWQALALATVTVALLGACAPLPPQTPEFQVGRARMALPQGAWEDLGATDEVIPLLPEVGGRIPLQTRAVALRGAKQELLAVMLVQTNSTNYPRDHTLWTGSCPQQKDVLVEDRTRGGHVRLDCLRFKRWASNGQWLEKNQPAVNSWMGQRQLAITQPYSYVGFRYATEGGALVIIDAVVDQSLLRPVSRNNEDFLVAGRPAEQWGRELAQAARVSAGMMDGFLAVPPFPFALEASR
jgi:hypothetical protein